MGGRKEGTSLFSKGEGQGTLGLPSDEELEGALAVPLRGAVL